MGLRKKYINSTLVNKTCSKCHKTYPRDEEHFYRRQHHSRKNTYKYSADCIRCDNERMKKWRVNHKEQKKQSDLKYVKSERGYFKALHYSMNRSNKGNLIKDFDEFMDCWERQKEKYGEYCPYYPHIKLTRIKGQGHKKTDSNISVDRLVNSLPYAKGNIMFISWKANNEKAAISPYIAKKMLSFIKKSKHLKLFVEIDTATRNNKTFIPYHKR